MESEKVKEIKKALEFCKDRLCEVCPRLKQEPNQEEDCRLALIGQSLTLINELESDNKGLQDLCNKTYEDLTKEIDRLENRVKELEDGIAKSMLGCEFLPECTKEKEKETATEIFKALYSMRDVYAEHYEYEIRLNEYNLQELAKQYGVEIKE